MHGEHGQIVAWGELDAEFGADFLELGGVFFAGGAVGYDAVAGFVFAHAVHDKVVNHAAFVVEHGGIEGFAHEAELGHVVGQKFAEEGFGFFAGHVGNQHVRHVEHAGVGAHGFVFGNLRAVVDGQLPAGEINQLGACVFVGLVEGGGFDGGHEDLLWGENGEASLSVPGT